MSDLYDAILESDQTASSPKDLPRALEAALSKRGLAIVKIGSVPPWMEWAASVSTDSDEGCSYREVFFYAGHENLSSGAPLYRLTTPGEES